MQKNTNIPTGAPDEGASSKMDQGNSILKSRAVRAVVNAVRAGVLAGTVASQLLANMGCGARTGLEDESGYVDDDKKHPAPAVDAGGGCMSVDAGGGCMGVDAGGGCMGVDAGGGCMGIDAGGGCMGLDAGSGCMGIDAGK